MALKPNKWQKKPVDPKNIMRDRLKEVLRAEKTSWLALAKQYDVDRSALQKSVESKVGTVNDFLNDIGYEIKFERIEPK